MLSAKCPAWNLRAASLGLVVLIAAPPIAYADSSKAAVHPPSINNQPPQRSAPHGLPVQTPTAQPALQKVGTSPSPRKATRRHHIQTASAGRRGNGVLALARCYGGFIAWRDELAGLMLQASSYTAQPDDQIRFDRMERSFIAGAKRERNLVLTLQPTFQKPISRPIFVQRFERG